MIVHLNDKCWLHYDGMVNVSQSYAKDVLELDVTGQLNFQGEGYGIIACYYINTSYEDSSMQNTAVTQESTECEIDITIEKVDTGLSANSTTNKNDSIKPDSKMPPHPLNCVFHLPYAAMNTEICSEEKEEDEYIE
jgi:hypothetical protein